MARHILPASSLQLLLLADAEGKPKTRFMAALRASVRDTERSIGVHLSRVVRAYRTRAEAALAMSWRLAWYLAGVQP